MEPGGEVHSDWNSCRYVFRGHPIGGELGLRLGQPVARAHHGLHQERRQPRRGEGGEAQRVAVEGLERRQQAFGRVQREAKLPGFRKGKVPRSMIKLHFADDVRQEVARRLIPDVYRQALAETRIEPVEEPDLQEVTLEENAALKFAAVVEVKPAITLGAYTGLKIEHTPKAFAESEVDEALTALQEQHAEYRAVERAADPGDLVIVDYTLTPEGMEPRSETGYGFVIGTGGVLPEMEEAVIGLAAGGSRQTRVRFGDDHRNEALRGKSAGELATELAALARDLCQRQAAAAPAPSVA